MTNYVFVYFHNHFFNTEVSNNSRATTRRVTFQKSQKTDFAVPWHQISTKGYSNSSSKMLKMIYLTNGIISLIIWSQSFKIWWYLCILLNMFLVWLRFSSKQEIGSFFFLFLILSYLLLAWKHCPIFTLLENLSKIILTFTSKKG